jgi:hypothetical protein
MTTSQEKANKSSKQSITTPMGALWRELENESPRGVILVFAMFIESAVRQLLHTSSVDEKAGEKIANDWTSISHMRNLALAFGLISRDEAEALETIAMIRNKFAHYKEDFSGVNPFGNAEVCKLIESIRAAQRRQSPDQQPAPMKTLLAPELLREAMGTLVKELPSVLNTLPESET